MLPTNDANRRENQPLSQSIRVYSRLPAVARPESVCQIDLAKPAEFFAQFCLTKPELAREKFLAH